MQRAGLLGGIAAGVAAGTDNAKSRGSSATGLSIINMTSILKLDRSNQRQLHVFTGRGIIPGTGTASTRSAKCDAYIWAKELFLDMGRCNAAQWPPRPATPVEPVIAALWCAACEVRCPSALFQP